MNTYRVTCICVWCSYGGGKLSPYVYLKTRSASSSPVALRAHWSFLYPKINSRKTTPLFSPLPLSLSLLTLFFFLSLILCFFCPLILPSILTSLNLSLIHAHAHPPPAPAHSSSVTPLSRGERAGAGLTVQEVLEGVTTPCCLLSSC